MVKKKKQERIADRNTNSDPNPDPGTPGYWQQF
jgi:hypothetical protein